MKYLLPIIFCMHAWTSIAMDAPSLKGIFNAEIFQLDNVDEDSSAEKIIEAFRAKKREQLEVVILKDLESNLKDMNDHDAHVDQWRMFARTIVSCALLPAAQVLPLASVPAMYAAHQMVESFVGVNIDPKRIEAVKIIIALYVSAIKNDPIARLEEHYIVEKYQRPMHHDLAQRIETILIMARSPKDLHIGAADFVRDALRLPWKKKQLNDDIDLDICDDVSEENRVSMNSFMTAICRQSKLDGKGVRKKSTSFIIFDSESPTSDAYAQRIAHALDLPCVNLVAMKGKDVFGTCPFMENNYKGDLATALSSQDGLVENTFVLIDFNRLVRSVDAPFDYLNDLLSNQKLASEYFGCDLDISRINFIVHFDHIDENYVDDFEQLLFSSKLPLLEVTAFDHAFKEKQIAIYAQDHSLFANSDVDDALALVIDNCADKKLSHQFELLEKLSRTPKEDWHNVLGLSSSLHELRLQETELEARVKNLQAQANAAEVVVDAKMKEVAKLPQKKFIQAEHQTTLATKSVFVVVVEAVINTIYNIATSRPMSVLHTVVWHCFFNYNRH